MMVTSDVLLDHKATGVGVICIVSRMAIMK